MKVIDKEEFMLRKTYFLDFLNSGVLFLHPTDTIYGLGCNAEDSEAVKNLRELKKRSNQPFTIIAPSKDWIRNHCEVSEEAEKWLSLLPGPYTLILKMKKNDVIATEVTNGLDTVGVRIPDHWMKDVVEELGYPIVSTSANIMGGDFMTSLDNLHHDISSGLGLSIYEGEKKGRPSKIVDLTSDGEIIER